MPKAKNLETGEIEDVQGVVNPETHEAIVENGEEGGDDKSKNLAALRKKNEELEAENERLRKGGNPNNNRSLEDDEEDEEDEKGKKKEKENVSEIIFKRDVKEATAQWNRKNKVSSEEWATIRAKVNLKGDETLSEITDKIDEAYISLPTVRAKRDKEILEKGKRIGAGEIKDEEMDMGGGGDGGSYESKRNMPINEKTKRWGKAMGLSDKEIEEASESDENPSEESEGPEPRKKFFSSAK